MLRGISTVSFWTTDLPSAVQWYTELLGHGPYVQRPGYAQFRIGDYEQELVLIDAQDAPVGHAIDPGGAIVYWHVDDVAGFRDRVLAAGARELEPVTDRGDGLVTASVVDPYGNVLGFVYSRHFLDRLPPSS
ncbi:VOC family protein [Arthrobacter mobilis]|uniref:VOC family protein n=1 Tax=Arthrobacter mobilis TaxID=2724944 RepID=A0A7X6HEU6_9MICC|nr:VOC family protein [Arthrobacter mobilis]NKX55849.1 VOC family protein [Arthrobacter mobilis]